MIPGSEQAKTVYALDRSATVTGIFSQIGDSNQVYLMSDLPEQQILIPLPGDGKR
jgi:hypothetical protein